MAIKTDTELKAYYVTGAIPTEAQYADFIDSKRSVNDIVPQDEVEKAAPYSASVGSSVAIPASSLLFCAVCIPTGSGTVLIGSTPGGNEYFDAAVTSGNTEIFDFKAYISSAASIYVGGTATGSVKFYIK